MASVIRWEERAPSLGQAGLSRARKTDFEGLAAFRLQVDPASARSLSTLIESEIIPRLMVAHAPATPVVGRAVDPSADRDAPAVPRAAIDPAELDTFAPLVMQVEADALLAHIENMLARGVTVETVMVDLLAPTARLLGEYWEDDRCDFVDVTMGLWRLQEVVHEIAGRAPTAEAREMVGRRALFASMPGDQHHFGTVVIDELFRRDGWRTERIVDAETPDLIARVANDWFDMIGLTISCACHIENLAPIIAALRNVSRNPRVCVMVGGRIFSEDPELALQIGADGTARDAKLALGVAVELVREREREAAACN